MAIAPVSHTRGIVVRGEFTPTLFHPTWFAEHGLIQPGEASAARIEIVHPKATVFALDWLSVNVTDSQVQFTTNLSAYFEVLRDLVVGTFRVLSQTPFRAVGINHLVHLPLSTEAAWHEMGHALAPKVPWKDSLKNPGMRAVVLWGEREDDRKGYVQVNVEPSGQVKFGVYVAVNDHFQLAEESAPARTDAGEIASLVSNEWTASEKRAEAVLNSVIRIAEAN